MLKVVDDKLTVKTLVDFLSSCPQEFEVVIKQAGKELRDLMITLCDPKEPEKFELIFK